MKLTKIWFEGEWIYGLSDDGRELRQSLLCYPRLREADSVSRSRYVFSPFGIHWPDIDEDVSFESFERGGDEPTGLQRFFLAHPEINVAGFARRVGINATLLRNYINGFKRPSADREAEIMRAIGTLGGELIRWSSKSE